MLSSNYVTKLLLVSIFVIIKHSVPKPIFPESQKETTYSSESNCVIYFEMPYAAF